MKKISLLLVLMIFFGVGGEEVFLVEISLNTMTMLLFHKIGNQQFYSVILHLFLYAMNEM